MLKQLVFLCQKHGPGSQISTTNLKQLSNAKLVQELLVQQGYYFGPVDGLIGSQTKLAIVGFQASIGVSQDGVVTPALLSQLENVGKPSDCSHTKSARY